MLSPVLQKASDVRRKVFVTFAAAIGKAVVEQAILWVSDPENRDDVEALGKAIFTATPWKWDDNLVKQIPDIAALPILITNEVCKRLPFLGGR